jgi:transcriptional regulator with XRE-family HTH domain
MKDAFSYSKNLKKLRLLAGLSQKELAKKLGISDKTISAYETGRAVPPSTTLLKLAKIIGIPVSAIFDVKSKKSEDEIFKRLEFIEKKISYLGPTPEAGKPLTLNAFVGVVLKDKKQRIFLIKSDDKYKISRKRWNLPSGSVDQNESLAEAAGREIKNKTGYQIKINSLLGCYKCKKGKSSWIYTVFEAEVIKKVGKGTDLGVKIGRWFTKQEFLHLGAIDIVHPDMQLVYGIAVKGKGLPLDSVKFIDYDQH